MERIPRSGAIDSRDEVVSCDIVAKRFLGTCKELFVRCCLKLLAEGKKANPLLLLDIGTGTADVPIRMIGKLPSAVIVAMDLSLSMLERARQNIADEELQDRILLVLGDAENLPFKDDSFHLVFSHSMFHHLVNPWIALQEIIRATKQGCCFIIRDLRRPPGFLLEWYVRIFGFRYDEIMKHMYRKSLRAGFTRREMLGIAGRIKGAVTRVRSFCITYVDLEGLKSDSGESLFNPNQSLCVRREFPRLSRSLLEGRFSQNSSLLCLPVKRQERPPYCPPHLLPVRTYSLIHRFPSP